ncbi:MAG: DNA alkylation repair protein [Thiohalorhabdaceae bacterium]
MDPDTVIDRLRQAVEPGAKQALAHMGIATDNALGVRVPRLREIARELGTDHELALGLWETGIHEAQLLATMVADPERVDGALMERWAAGFDAWDVADQAVANLFAKAEPAWTKKSWCAGPASPSWPCWP